jgi:hypothetical protein
MIRGLGIAGVLALASGLAYADTIVAASGENFVNMPASILNPGIGTNCGLTGNSSGNCGYVGSGPYWDNESGKGNEGNVGYILSSTCGTPANCLTNYNPVQYVAGASSSASPTSITLDHTTPATVTLLGDTTGDTTDSFGYYDVSNPNILYTLFGPGSMLGDIGVSTDLPNLVNGGGYGFFITKSCHTLCPAGDATPGYVTWYSNDALDASDIGNQHFALFTSPTTGIYYIGIEDWGLFGGTGNGEGNGDFADIVFELNSSVPEPATFGLIGAGLLSFGLMRLRIRKRRA